MRYTIQSGILTAETSQEVLATIKSSVIGPVKKIYKNSDEPVAKTDICPCDPCGGYTGDVRGKEYVMVSGNGERIAVAYPGYSESDNPDAVGWPICRMPKVDHASITAKDADYSLIMDNSRSYSLRNGAGQELLRIVHKGIAGGWNLEDRQGFPPEVLCGIFSFCRYLEQENEFLIV